MTESELADQLIANGFERQFSKLFLYRLVSADSPIV